MPLKGTASIMEIKGELPLTLPKVTSPRATFWPALRALSGLSTALSAALLDSCKVVQNSVHNAVCLQDARQSRTIHVIVLITDTTESDPRHRRPDRKGAWYHTCLPPNAPLEKIDRSTLSSALPGVA